MLSDVCGGMQKEGISQISGSVKASFQNVKDFFSGPQSTLEELQSGAEDGLSRSDISLHRQTFARTFGA